MGQTVAKFREDIKKVDQGNKDATLEQLNFLVHSANAKLDKYESQLNEMFLNPEGTGKIMVTGGRALRFERGYQVKVTNKGGTDDSPIGDIVSTFFGSGDKESDAKSNILNGFKKLINGALGAFLGNTDAGEQETQKFFVFCQHNAIIRIDVKLWRYNFSGVGVIAQTEDVVAWIFTTSVVETSTLKFDELVYLFSEYAGDAAVADYIESLFKIWRKIAQIKALQKAIDSGDLDNLEKFDKQLQKAKVVVKEEDALMGPKVDPVTLSLKKLGISATEKVKEGGGTPPVPEPAPPAPINPV